MEEVCCELGFIGQLGFKCVAQRRRDNMQGKGSRTIGGYVNGC